MRAGDSPICIQTTWTVTFPDGYQASPQPALYPTGAVNEWFEGCDGDTNKCYDPTVVSCPPSSWYNSGDGYFQGSAQNCTVVVLYGTCGIAQMNLNAHCANTGPPMATATLEHTCYCAPTPFPGPSGCPSGESWEWSVWPTCKWQREVTGSPIIVRLDPAVDWASAFSPLRYQPLDWDGNGHVYAVPVISNPQAFACLLDRSCAANSAVMSAKCLLGSATPQPPCPGGTKECLNGFRALATEYDSNHDGVFGPGDTAYNDNQIVLWRQQGDWTPRPEQYEALPAAGVLGVSLDNVKEEPYRADGVLFHLKSFELTPQGQFPVHDVYLPLLPAKR